MNIGGDIIYSVYIDRYFSLNFILIFFILLLSRDVLKSKVTWRRIIVGDFLGTIGCCITIFLPTSNMIIKIIIGYIISSIFMIWFVFKVKTLKRGVTVIVVVYGMASLLGGILAMSIRFTPSILGISIVATICIKIICYFYHKQTKDKIFIVTLYDYNEQKIVIKGLIDTGNSLYDPITKKPISIIDKECFSTYSFTVLEEKFHAIPFSSVGKNNGILKGYEIKKMTVKINEEEMEVLKPIIAISEEKISNQNKYQIIIHPDFMNTGRKFM
ncbi:MAG: sigma-E processing peptidase SpoIIGA [Lachnospiraceae bacterium]